MADFVLGVAGHVDHGKTALTRALTGVDTDRLPEEKRRGLTIEPGYAALTLPSGTTVALVDVPGHKAFIRNMLVGTAGVSAVLLCVAADDGVMPQTREHLDICALLGVRSFVVAITKSDLADEGRVAAVAAQIRALPHLADAPVIPLSVKTGGGISALVAALAVLSQGTEHIAAQGKPFRMEIDRVFSKEGFGTVVTGTVTNGTVSVGDLVEIYPKGVTVRVRGLQGHGTALDSLTAGHRAALNLAGIDCTHLRRGDTAAAPGSMTVTDRGEATLEVLPYAGFPIKTGSLLHFCHGAREQVCRCTLRGDRVRLKFTTPIAARVGDPFVVRFFSPEVTVGGGVLTRLSIEKRRREQAPTLVAVLAEYHAKYPLRPGMPQAELLQKCGTLEGAVIHGAAAALPGFKPKYLPALAKIRDQIEVYYRRHKATPAPNSEADALFDDEVIRRLLADGVLVAVGKDRRIHRRYLEVFQGNG